MGSTVIAVEGPDLCGKTTFLGKIREVPQVAYWPVFRIDLPRAILADPKGNEIDEVCRAFSYGMIEVKHQGLSFFLDRTYVSAWVYNQVFERSLSVASFAYDVAATLRPLIVYVQTSIDVILERLERRGDVMLSAWDPRTRSRLMAIHQAYEEWARVNPFNDQIITVGRDGQAMPYETAQTIVNFALAAGLGS